MAGDDGSRHAISRDHELGIKYQKQIIFTVSMTFIPKSRELSAERIQTRSLRCAKALIKTKLKCFCIFCCISLERQRTQHKDVCICACVSVCVI